MKTDIILAGVGGQGTDVKGCQGQLLLVGSGNSAQEGTRKSSTARDCHIMDLFARGISSQWRVAVRRGAQCQDQPVHSQWQRKGVGSLSVCLGVLADGSSVSSLVKYGTERLLFRELFTR